MLLGPVFNAELVTTARRARYFVVRFVYGLIILFQIYLSYQSNAWRIAEGRGEMRINQMADFGRSIFTTFAILQAVVVILLTPALVGGTIADERQRKTLHYLLTSELTGLEIVLGKLAARLLHVGVLVAVGFPVVCLIGLFGGIDFQLLLLSYAGTLTTVYFLAGLSILVSVFARRPREAITLLYLLEMAWLIVPTLLMTTMRYWPAPWPAISGWTDPVLRWVAITSPIYLFFQMGPGGLPMGPRGTGTLVNLLLWGMGLQVAYGTCFVILAAFRLRPSSRSEGASPRWMTRFTEVARRRKWLPRPECGDDAMLWKERYVSRTGGLTKVALALLGVGVVGIIGYSGFDLVVAAGDELRRNGSFLTGHALGDFQARRDFSTFLRIACTALYVLWMLGIASGAACGLTSEREEDTWLILTSTPMDGDEIVRAKMIGPIWALRPAAYLLFALWGIGLVVGSIHPLGVLATAAEFAVFTWFLTAVGTFFSLRSKNSTRALASTMALLIFTNGGYLFCCIPFRPDSGLVVAGSTPALMALSLLSLENLGEMSQRENPSLVAASILGLVGYGVAAFGLTLAAFGTFDAVVDRPRRELSPEQVRRLSDAAKKPGAADEVA